MEDIFKSGNIHLRGKSSQSKILLDNLMYEFKLMHKYFYAMFNNFTK